MLQLHLHFSLEITVPDKNSINLFNRAAMSQPRPLPEARFDIDVDRLPPSFAVSVTRMVEHDLLAARMVKGRRLIASSELSGFVPAGCCLDDATSAFFISADARI